MSILNNYIELLNNLDTKSKLALIAHLSNSILSEKEYQEREKTFFACFGALKTDETADELIEMIRESRVFRKKDIIL